MDRRRAKGQEQGAGSTEQGEQFLRLAQRVEPTHLVGAHYTLGGPLFRLGEFASVRVHLEQGVVLYNSQQHHSLAFVYGINPGVSCLSFLAWTLWFLGYPDQARKRVQEVLALAQELSHPFSLAHARQCATIFHQLCREAHANQEQAEALIALSIEQGFPEWLAIGTILRGWALAEQGPAEEDIAQLHQGLVALQAIGTEVERPYYLALLPEAYRKVGQIEEGLSVLAEAVTMVNKNGERYYEAELYRLKGQLTLQQFNVQGSKFKVENSSEFEVRSSESEAEEYFKKAIEIACQQQAKSLELRAVMSLSRLWQQQGKTKEAHDLLAEIYNWFTEGFDTKDLQEAKVLLNELT